MKYPYLTAGMLILLLLHCSPDKSGGEARASRGKNTSQLDTVAFADSKYIVFEADAKSSTLELFNEIDRSRVHTFQSILTEKKKKKEVILFAMNAGMYDQALRPVGLYISKGITIRSVNLRTTGTGNFYDLPPNGIFAIDEKNKPAIFKSSEYITKSKTRKFRIATQSGPLLVTGGKINGLFREGSQNLNIRNAVGINKNGNVVFVVSLNKVNFFDFALLFRDRLNCSEALYLDGVISQWFVPGIHEPACENPLAPILTACKSMKK